MNSTYAQKSSTIQKAADTKAASVLDSSAQSDALQRKADMANNAAQRAEAPRPNNTGMPDNLKAGIESLSGFSMDDVRVHYNSSKPATVQALAYTQGTDIHVAPGQEKHLPHEAWHVAQQMAGRVSPTTNINGMPVNDNAGLEHEADVMGEKAAQLKSDESMTVQRATIWNGVVQRIGLENYYYHISGGEIVGDINPKCAIQPRRTRSGDDLGPGFYMGDSNFLPYYYGEWFLDKKSVYIYYIEKKLIDDNPKLNIMDFTDEEKTNNYGLGPNKLFQIAMELGFADKSGKIALDLLADSGNMVVFRQMVENKYGNDANGILNFFKEANKKVIWKGYLNDVHKEKIIASLDKADIERIINDNTENEKLLKQLSDEIPTKFEYTSNDELDQKIRVVGDYIRGINPKPKFSVLDFTRAYKHLVVEKSTKKYDYVKNEEGAKPPIQIAIRPDVEVEDVEGAKDVKPEEGAKGEKTTLLKKIKENKIEVTQAELEAARTKSGTEGDAKNEGPKQGPLKTAETESETKGDAKNEESKQEPLKTVEKESEISNDLKSQITKAFAEEREKRSQK